MIQQHRALEADFVLQIEGVPADDLAVSLLDGEEALGQFFRFRLGLCSANPDLDPAMMLGKVADLEIHGADGTRHVHGIVGQFERTGNGHSHTYYSVDIVPEHWLLTQRVQSRIFQAHNCADMSVPGIIERVFDTAGIPDDRYQFELYGDYQPRNYVVQYCESDADFLCRLMEEEGIYFFFEHGPDACRLVMADLPDGHPELPGEATFSFRDPNGLLSAERRERFDGLRERRSIASGAVTFDDYNFRTPGKDLETTRAGKTFTALEHSDYPGRFVDEHRGGRLAQVRLESIACVGRSVELTGNVRTLLPGYTFQLADHPAERLNRGYLLTRVRHMASRPQAAEEGALDGRVDYRVEVEVLPADVQFRLPQVTPRPIVRGSQTAIVVGPKNEEIYTDEYGRVKVQFHWDRERRFDEFSSCWIRVSHGMAGGGYGMMFLPRVGQEVVVDFLEGNPDCPLVTGSVYNNDHMPPYPLPDEKTRSCIKTNSSKGGKGTNEIRFEDAKGKEHLLIHAQRSLHTRAKGNAYHTVGCDHHRYVKRDQLELTERDRHTEVWGDHHEMIQQNRYSVVQELLKEYIGTHVQFVDQTYHLKSFGKAIVEADEGITLRCGGNFITIDQTGVWISATHIGLNSGGTPLMNVADTLFETPLDAKAARTTKPGRDVHYSGDNTDPNDDPVPNNGGDDDDPTEKKTHWIEIEMRDEIGRPWSDEEYEIIGPDGKVYPGTLDKNGVAREELENPGMCQIRFPKIDAAAWRRLS